MPVYPIEISGKLKRALQLAQPPSTSAESDDFAKLEALWIEAILTLESGNQQLATTQFSKVIQQLHLNSDVIADPKLITDSQLFVIASYAELLLIEPMRYYADNQLIKQLRRINENLAKDRLKARLSHALAIVMVWRRDSKQALQLLFQSREIYHQLKEELGNAFISDTLGSVYSSLADQQQALLYYSESLAVKTHLGDNKGRAITLGNLARLCLQMGRFEQAAKFANLDLQLCLEETAATRARLLNLLARISLAAKQWHTAEKYLYDALELHDNQDIEGLFFCQKDCLNLKLEKGEGVTIEDLQALKLYVTQLSPYHQLQFDILQRKVEQNLGTLDFTDAEKTLESIQLQNLPEIELDYLIWFVSTAFNNKRFELAKQQLLVARKMAKKHGFKRFNSKINSLMLQYDIHENITEETHRPITESIEQVDDGYLIRKKLGSGGFGDVFLAHDMIHDRDIALKKFHLGNQWDYHELQKKWNLARIEFEAVASIKHPAVAQTYALGHDNFGSPYLVQEYLSGGELRSLMTHPGDLNKVLRYMIPVVQGLAAIHQTGVIHRDLKPENILLNAQGMPVIVDFGIALLKQTTLNNSHIQGSENYTAPEQRESTEIDHRADLYSIGCILYEWISGKPPEMIPIKAGILGQWLAGSSNVKIEKSLFGDASQLIKSLLHYNPEKRPKDANELVSQLNALKS